MTRQISDLLEALDALAPFATAAEWDAVGLQLGDAGRPCGRVAVAHEVTVDVARRGAELGLDTIVTYHPLVFRPLGSVTAASGVEGRVLGLLEAKVAVVSMHTNWDAAPGGAADALAAGLGLEIEDRFAPVDERPDAKLIGRIGAIAAFEELVAVVGERLGTTPRTAGVASAKAGPVAVVPGSGGSFIADAARAGAAVLVTGDVSHHEARAALDLGMAVVDPGHAATERPGVRALYAAVSEIVTDAVDLTGVDDSPWEGD